MRIRSSDNPCPSLPWDSTNFPRQPRDANPFRRCQGTLFKRPDLSCEPFVAQVCTGTDPCAAVLLGLVPRSPCQYACSAENASSNQPYSLGPPKISAGAGSMHSITAGSGTCLVWVSRDATTARKRAANEENGLPAPSQNATKGSLAYIPGKEAMDI